MTTNIKAPLLDEQTSLANWEWQYAATRHTTSFSDQDGNQTSRPMVRSRMQNWYGNIKKHGSEGKMKWNLICWLNCSTQTSSKHQNICHDLSNLTKRRLSAFKWAHMESEQSECLSRNCSISLVLKSLILIMFQWNDIAKQQQIYLIAKFLPVPKQLQKPNPRTSFWFHFWCSTQSQARTPWMQKTTCVATVPARAQLMKT